MLRKKDKGKVFRSLIASERGNLFYFCPHRSPTKDVITLFVREELCTCSVMSVTVEAISIFASSSFTCVCDVGSTHLTLTFTYPTRRTKFVQ